MVFRKIHLLVDHDLTVNQFSSFSDDDDDDDERYPCSDHIFRKDEKIVVATLFGMFAGFVGYVLTENFELSVVVSSVVGVCLYNYSKY